jgi:hypothetical protein
MVRFGRPHVTSKRVGVFGAGALGCLIIVSAVAWACTFGEGPYVDELATQAAPAGAQIAIRGGHWVASEPVDLDWRSTSSQVGQPLGTVLANSTGHFSADIHVPDVPPGLYYIAVSQPSAMRATGFEVLAADGARAQRTNQGSLPLQDGLDTGFPDQGSPSAANDSNGSPLSVGLVVAMVAVAGMVAVGALMFIERRRAVTIPARD